MVPEATAEGETLQKQVSDAYDALKKKFKQTRGDAGIDRKVPRYEWANGMVFFESEKLAKLKREFAPKANMHRFAQLIAVALGEAGEGRLSPSLALDERDRFMLVLVLVQKPQKFRK